MSVQEKSRPRHVRQFSEDSARAAEAAAKTAYNVQSLPPSSIAIVGALDTSGVYRVAQLSIYENKQYVGAIALAEAGGYGEGAQPAVPQSLLDEGPKDADIAVHYNLADGVYSAGVRNNVPEPVIREAIQLLGKLTDLKAPLQPEENIRALYAHERFLARRHRNQVSGKVIYIGLTGPGGAVDCYSFQSADGGFRCFDPKSGGAPAAGPAPTSVGGIFAPIKGAPVTSTFGMRFHPILHILRLHAGIDFGAPIGSQVRSVADGKVEIAGPVSGFGNHVRVQHKGFETSYSHLSEIMVTVGATVTQGQVVGLSGNTGLSTGPHLHFEYYLDRVAVDPLPHMGTEVAGSGGGATSSGPSEQEVAAFYSGKAPSVDAALQTVSRWRRDRLSSTSGSSNKGRRALVSRRYSGVVHESLIAPDPAIGNERDCRVTPPGRVCADGARIVFAADDDDRNIVGRAALQRQRNEPGAGLLRVVGVQQRRDFAVRDMVGQSVAAQKKSIPRHDRPIADFERRLIGDAQRPRDHIAPRPAPGLMWFENAAVDEVLNFGMIARDLRQRSGAQPIGAAVAAPDAGVVAAMNEDAATTVVPTICVARALASARKSALTWMMRSSNCARNWAADLGSSIGRQRCDRSAPLARSPPPCPPIPSATAHRPISGRAIRLSSLTSRTLPTCVADAVLKTNGLDIARSFYGFSKQAAAGFEKRIASRQAS